MRPLLHLGPNVITDRTFITLGFEMLLQIGPLLHWGPVVTLVPSTGLFKKQSKQNETESIRIKNFNSLYLRHCFMLPFSPLSYTFHNNFTCYACRFFCKNFFLRITACRIFFRQVSLPGLIFRELSPHLRLFLMPSVPF